MKLKIVDATWKIVLQTPDEFIKTHGQDYTDAAALTDPNVSKIYFRTDDIHEKYVFHELFHAYFNSTLTNDCTLDMGQTEELSANIVGKYGPELIKKGRRVYKYLNAQRLTIDALNGNL